MNLEQKAARIQHIIDNKTKPLGALGVLEKTALELALLSPDLSITKIAVDKPALLVFAGDHGIAEEGVSIAPSVVTTQMVQNFLAGGAAINCFCRANNIPLTIVDTGILTDIEHPSPDFVKQRLGSITKNLANEAAMSVTQVDQGLALGRELVQQKIASGSNLLMFGEMGIGNTSSAAALFAAFSGEPVANCVGKGTGINDAQLNKKVSLIEQALSRVQLCLDQPLELLRQVGGFEITQMVGGFLGASQQRVPVLVDGFIVTVAAYVATIIEPNVRDVLLFAHRSEESAHHSVLSYLNAKPLLELNMRLGEGTGAALAYPLVNAAAEFYNNMASFEDAGVTV
ncbi:nicotinate-nucleotide--dimethylbenzimidazole phosphoribosyltransferase [Thaumasiovibrio sp. DFM-14]|uniref:nicotinate-nucleotide--dimethylbenzimidazole phosphoribosyltransferase n=1 Tax=Thaumasiovibrio sp. DFM-14 TaxID=3384792 RepID=UPI00399F8CFE